MQIVNALPNNEDAEKGLIGLTLVKKQIPMGAKILSTTDFYNPFYRVAWSAFLELEADSLEIDTMLAMEIINRERPDFSITQLTNTATGIPNTNEEVFVKAIRSAATRRHLINKLSEGIRSLEKGGKDVISSLRRELNDLEFAEDLRGSFTPLSQIVDTELKQALAELREGRTNKISTGFEAIDRVIGGGLSLSDVLLIAGLPGGGKSALALQLAANIAGNNIPVAYVSGEMSNVENSKRLLSQYADYMNLNSAIHLNETDYDILMQWAEWMKQLPIYFDSKTYDLRTLGVALRPLVETTGAKVLVIDYIQLFKSNKYDKLGRTERISECSQEVKRLAMEFGIAVIEVAQFNREGAKSGKPGMHDLDGSSQLEKDTSLIFILDREEGTTNVVIRVEKGRNSGNAVITGRFDGWKLKFEF